MKDIIWTLIIVWLIYKIIDVFRSSTAKRTSENQTDQRANTTSGNSGHHAASRPDQDIKNAVKQHLNNEGEYVDFEEVK